MHPVSAITNGVWRGALPGLHFIAHQITDASLFFRPWVRPDGRRVIIFPMRTRTDISGYEGALAFAVDDWRAEP